MITRTDACWQTEDWQIQLSNAITDVRELLKRLKLDPAELEGQLAAQQLFAVKVPLAFVEKMTVGDVHDPLLRQVLPLAEELRSVNGFVPDPLAEGLANRCTGLLHKYRSRVLVVLSGACAVNCRYCFRRHFDYHNNRLTQADIERIATYVEADKAINEVVLSGGDPLVVSNRRLAELIQRLGRITHLKRLRVHTRMPVVIPQRIDEELLGIISGSRLRFIVVLHANHANELDETFCKAMGLLAKQGVLLLNQSVLLKGVNDRSEVLAQLSEALFDAGVQPYYLHLLDRVSGTAHFDVSEAAAKRIMAQLQARLPGFLVPKLVREVPGEPSKSLVNI